MLYQGWTIGRMIRIIAITMILYYYYTMDPTPFRQLEAIILHTLVPTPTPYKGIGAIADIMS